MEKLKRYVIMGLHNGKLVRIIARRGHDPDDIIRQALGKAEPWPFLPESAKREKRFDRLYILEVGDEGVYGQCTNLKLQEIVSPAPVPSYGLVDVESIF